ncbi:MAG: thiol:disulfide interchange protein DsbA/DsbL [Deltaproteobacteria bacterium]|jgi:thiol:disulfide interchange protein DsbA|nr:thiol:disulfide interchange protein DsbA/DsbL [Deltaproteobacteria bacterium]
MKVFLRTHITAIVLALAISLGLSSAAPAQLPFELTDQERANFKVILKPARYDESDDKIELVTVFWYGCASCRSSDATTSLFASSLPEDVRATRLPGLFDNARMPFQTHARLFFVLDELNAESAARQAAFDTALNVHNPNARNYGLITKESQETFAASQGISRAAFNAAYDSPAVAGKEARAKTFLENSGIDAVPGMIINGRYVITNFDGPYYQLAEKLINHERDRLAKAKAEAAKAGEAKGDAAKADEAKAGER